MTLTRDAFLAEMHQLANPTQVGTAGGEVAESPARTARGDENPLMELRRALNRLQADPSGEEVPETAFTFEDPILAVALYWRRKAEQVKGQVGHAGDGSELHDLSFAMVQAGISDWLKRGSKAFDLLGQRVPSGPVSEQGDTMRLAVLGDAGYAGKAQATVLEQVERIHQLRPFGYLVHLGDTYFGGQQLEVHQNLIVPLSRLRNKTGVRILTLCGNHDLYYGPEGYADALDVFGQPGRYFLLQTPHWRVACLDTSLAAERKFRNDGQLDKEQLEWLDHLLTAADPRPLLLMSHHFIVSAWGGISDSLYAQLGSRVSGKVFAWYWGHEHSCVAYGNTPYGSYGACVGNGCYVEPHRPPRQDVPFPPEWYAQGRCQCYGPSDNWPHGFLELELAPDGVRECYHLEDGSTFERLLPRRGEGKTGS